MDLSACLVAATGVRLKLATCVMSGEGGKQSALCPAIERPVNERDSTRPARPPSSLPRSPLCSPASSSLVSSCPLDCLAFGANSSLALVCLCPSLCRLLPRASRRDATHEAADDSTGTNTARQHTHTEDRLPTE